MMTELITLRRGLPRTPGGEAWPPAAVGAPAMPEAHPDNASLAELPPPAVQRLETAREGVSADTADTAGGPYAAVTAEARVAPVGAEASIPPDGIWLRRGLPRTAGGDAPSAAAPADARPEPGGTLSAEGAGPGDSAGVAAGDSAERQANVDQVKVRRGLPRTVGKAPTSVSAAAEDVVPIVQVPTAVSLHEPVASVPKVAPVRLEAPNEASAANHLEAAAPLARSQPVGELAPSSPERGQRRELKRFGRFTWLQWVGAILVGAAALFVLLAALVLLTRWLMDTEPMHEFLQTYPGEYHVPEGTPLGLPAWLGWQHFFNVFLMVLIIRSGLQVRQEQRPGAYWAPRGNPKEKISLASWFHQSLDILWMLNGAVFIVLLIATGQWMRIVPTSWEVFPNAISAALQYLSLQWPTENGWVSYNSLQQLAYFVTVFVAAPLSFISGVRMSGAWPKRATTLNRFYPIEVARKIHFPVMLYFVSFIIVHIGLVLATGALRNLNHMYAAQDAVNWTGFWIFLASMLLIGGSWVAARPLILAPIARLFGTVTRR